MSILKVRNKPNSGIKKKFIGLILSEQSNSYLSLYALSKETTKSMIIRDQIEKWRRNESVITSIEELIEIIVNKSKQEWDSRKASNPNALLATHFRIELEKDLRSKGIDENYILTILTALKNYQFS